MYRIKGYLSFFCLFLFITGVYDGVQDDKERGREKRRKTVKNERKRGETRETTKRRRDRNREKDQSMIQAAWVLIAGFYCRVCKLRDRYRWILLRLPPFQVSRLFFLFLYSVCSLSGLKTKIHDSHLVIQACSSEREVQIGLRFFLFFSFAFLQKRVPDSGYNNNNNNIIIIALDFTSAQ